MNAIRKILVSGSAVFLLAGAALAEPAPGSLNSSSGMIALNSLPNPPTTLATANVADAKGTIVGAVRKVVMDGNDKPVTVDVALLGSQDVVAVDAAKFNYDQAHNVLTAQLDAVQIAQQPRAPQG
jgi:hypothetical protein